MDKKECETTFNDVEKLTLKNKSTEKCFIDNERGHFRENTRGFCNEKRLSEKTVRNSDESIEYKNPLIKNSYASKSVLKSMKMFEKAEAWNGGFIPLYSMPIRCPDGKISAEIESVSLQDEIQQGLIDESVCDPTKRLTTNLHRNK